MDSEWALQAADEFPMKGPSPPLFNPRVMFPHAGGHAVKDGHGKGVGFEQAEASGMVPEDAPVYRMSKRKSRLKPALPGWVIGAKGYIAAS